MEDMVNRTRVEGGGYSKHDIITSVEVLVLWLKNVSCEYDLFEWLKPNFASCVVHQARSYNMFFVN